MLVARRAGCLGAVGSLAGWSGVPGVPPSCTLEVAAQAFRSDVRVALSDTEADEDRRVEAATSMTIYVCITCRRAGEPEDELRPGAVLARATARAAARQRRHRAAGRVPRQLQPQPERGHQRATAPGPMCSAGSMPTRDAEALIEGAQLFAARGRRPDALARPARDVSSAA